MRVCLKESLIRFDTFWYLLIYLLIVLDTIVTNVLVVSRHLAKSFYLYTQNQGTMQVLLKPQKRWTCLGRCREWDFKTLSMWSGQRNLEMSKRDVLNTNSDDFLRPRQSDMSTLLAEHLPYLRSGNQGDSKETNRRTAELRFSTGLDRRERPPGGLTRLIPAGVASKVAAEFSWKLSPKILRACSHCPWRHIFSMASYSFLGNLDWTFRQVFSDSKTKSAKKNGPSLDVSWFAQDVASKFSPFCHVGWPLSSFFSQGQAQSCDFISHCFGSAFVFISRPGCFSSLFR